MVEIHKSPLFLHKCKNKHIKNLLFLHLCKNKRFFDFFTPYFDKNQKGKIFFSGARAYPSRQAGCLRSRIPHRGKSNLVLKKNKTEFFQRVLNFKILHEENKENKIPATIKSI
ncbi:MAG: hypothetical protein CRN43_22615 [Candidatus Nephrothrix sp. EaCA]|nr:MAG: hypothetical protein CRN43_22615 [Candidatus Nephrothrix sp. EaCA]